MRSFIWLGLCLLFVGANADDRPNILFIFTDDQSHRSVGCYPEAYDWVKTPNIDDLAEKGVRFANCYMGSWCMASRAMFLTGRYTYGIQSMRMEGEYPGSEYDPEECPFFPAEFRKGGYHTAQIGKWHTGTDNGFGRDWDFQMVWNRPALPGNSGKYFDGQLIQVNGEKEKLIEGYSTDNYTDWAVDYIEGKRGRTESSESDKPWFLWLCYGAVHAPFTPADRHLDAYPGVKAKIPEDIYPPREGKPEYSRTKEQWIPGPNGVPAMKSGKFAGRTIDDQEGLLGNDIHSLVRQYHQGVLALDEAVGRLVKTLKATDQYDNTLIVFASDQGIAWGQKGFQVKLAPYDGTIRGPLIISMPKKYPQGEVCEKAVGAPDLVPLFCDLAKVELPWKIHGRDIAPLMKDPEAADWDSPLLMVHTGMRYGEDCDVVPEDMSTDRIFSRQGIPWWVSLRDDRFKYIRNLLPNEVEELYDMEKDPEELQNLALKTSHRDTLQKMRAQAIQELLRTDCKFAESMPPVATE